MHVTSCLKSAWLTLMPWIVISVRDGVSKKLWSGLKQCNKQI